jgi:molybdopterin-binding protein
VRGISANQSELIQDPLHRHSRARITVAAGLQGTELTGEYNRQKYVRPILRRHAFPPRAFYKEHMTISARNKLRGKIEEIQLGDIMAHVVVRVGDNLIESAITRRSADELKHKKGDTVTAVVKATEVMIQKD